MGRAFSKKNLWEKTPLWLKSTLGKGLGLIPPAWWLGRSFRENCRFLRDAQWWSRERTHQYQLDRLHDMLRLAYEKAPFYRRTFESVGFHPSDLRSLEDLSSLPTIDKKTVIQNLQDLCTKSVAAKDVDYGSTGGTSGTPLHFYLDAGRHAIEYAYLTTSWERAGYKLGMPMAVLRGRIVRPDRNECYHEYDPILRHHYYSDFHTDDGSLGRYLQHIRGIGPCMFHAYPSSAFAVARYLTAARQPGPQNIKGILLESENVYAVQIEEIERTFGVRTFSSYGHSEKLVLAAQCEHSRDYHVWPTYGYFELLDEHGHQIATPGQRGEIVGTGFMSTVMPFIRYRTGDEATYVGDRCEACGREQVIIKDIRGHRTQEVLVTVNGSEVSWTALNMHDDTFLHVRQFQFMQETPGEAVLHIVPAVGFREEDVQRVQRNLERKLDGQLAFTVELVDAIPLSPQGKAIYVDQRIAQRGSDLLADSRHAATAHGPERSHLRQRQNREDPLPDTP
jgi:phenylacetate-CoA ligase